MPKGIYEHHSAGKHITHFAKSGKKAKLPVICLNKTEWKNMTMNLKALDARNRARVKISALVRYDERMGA